MAELSYQPEYGARPVKRAVNELIVDALALKVLEKDVSVDYEILVSERDGDLRFCNVMD